MIRASAFGLFSVGAILAVSVGVSELANIVLLVWLIFCVLSLFLSEKHPWLRSEFLLGVLTLLLPALGSGVLLAAVFIFLLTRKGDQRSLHLGWISPFLLLLLVWVLCPFVIQYRSSQLGVLGTDLLALGARDRFIAAARYLSLFALYEHFEASSRERRTSMLTGITVGASVSLFVTLLEIAWPQLISFPNQTLYWTSIGRIPGTFTDPNAFGISLVLVIPLVIYLASRSTRVSLSSWCLVLVAGLTVVALYSGSRSFFIGMGLSLLFLLSCVRWWLPVALLVLGTIALIGVNEGFPQLLAEWHLGALPIGLDRLFSALDYSHLQETFFSRLVFWKLSLRIWLDHFFLGVGFGGFREQVVPYANALGLGTHLWIDNANNFYLSVLAETGLFGFILLALCLGSLRLSDPSKLSMRSVTTILGRFEVRVFAASLLVFAILLVFGPHVEFDEVCVLLSFILAHVVVRSRKKSTSIGFFRMLLAAVLFITVSFGALFRTLYSDFGLYAWETTDGGYHRWTRRYARIGLPCTDSNIAWLHFRLLHPNIESEPVTVWIFPPDGEQLEFQIDSSEVRSHSFACHSLGLEESSGPILSKIYLSLELSRTFKPALSSESRDQRDLGAQLFFRQLPLPKLPQGV